jgi:hypothetical protein
MHENIIQWTVFKRNPLANFNTVKPVDTQRPISYTIHHYFLYLHLELTWH